MLPVKELRSKYKDAFLKKSRAFARRYEKRHRKKLNKMYYENQPADVVEALYVKLALLVSVSRHSKEKNSPRISKQTQTLFGHQSKTVPMEFVSRAIQLKGTPKDRFAWVISDKQQSSGQGTSRVLVGRAVFGEDKDLKTGKRRGVKKQVIHKGVGPTKYAGNRYNGKTSGTFHAHSGPTDWRVSEYLAESGIAAYAPLSLDVLPMLEWHHRQGWLPIAIYSRLGDENVRVGDLDALSMKKRRELIGELATKLEVLTGETNISTSDVLRFFAARMGRNYGLAESGKNSKGKRFFHGMLHTQNVSVLGELVDFGENRGRVKTLKELSARHKDSGYVIKERGFPPSVVGGQNEMSVYQWLVAAFVSKMNKALAPAERVQQSEIEQLFKKGYADGRKGRKATHVRETYRASK